MSQTKSIRIILLIIHCIFLGFGLSGCGESDPNILKVKNAITETHASGRNYKAGSLKGGTGVLVDGMAAYWVSGETVYAANGHAKAWSPDVPYTKDAGITFSAVKKAVK